MNLGWYWIAHHKLSHKEPLKEIMNYYELLDKYSQPQIPETTPTKSEQQKTLSAGDYEFTHCPAYVPVTHGNQETETSLRQQPTTGSADDDGMGEYEMVSPN